MEKYAITYNRIIQNIDFVEKNVKRNGDNGMITGEDTDNMLKALQRIRTEVSLMSLCLK